MLFRQHPIRAQADSAIFGGIVDVKFEAASRAFFEEVKKRLIMSASRLNAPRVRAIFYRPAALSIFLAFSENWRYNKKLALSNRVRSGSSGRFPLFTP